MRVTPYQLGFEVDEGSLFPGQIYRKLDGSLWEISPGGSPVPLGSGGGSTPITITFPSYINETIGVNPDGFPIAGHALAGTPSGILWTNDAPVSGSGGQSSVLTIMGGVLDSSNNLTDGVVFVTDASHIGSQIFVVQNSNANGVFNIAGTLESSSNEFGAIDLFGGLTARNGVGIVFSSTDPGVEGAWWNDSGVLTMSAG